VDTPALAQDQDSLGRGQEERIPTPSGEELDLGIGLTSVGLEAQWYLAVGFQQRRFDGPGDVRRGRPEGRKSQDRNADQDFDHHDYPPAGTCIWGSGFWGTRMDGKKRRHGRSAWAT
jgi:hypothetical protein